MLRELTQQEYNAVSGGAVISTDIVEVYPASIPGYALVGWTEQVVGWDIYTWDEYGLFTTIIHEEKIPIYEIQPLYLPMSSTVYVY